MRKPKETPNPFSPEQLQAQAERAAAEVPWDPNESNAAAEEIAVAPPVQSQEFEEDLFVDSTKQERDDSWLDALRAPLPANLIKHRVEKWGEVAYVEWHTVADILDQELGSRWSFYIKDIEVNQFAVICKGQLDVSDINGWQSVTREGLGVAPIHVHGGVPNIELAAKSAASDALKRAAVLFGVGRDLYTGEVDDPSANRESQTEPAQQNARTNNFQQGGSSQGTYQRPTSGNFQMREPNAPATPKQIGMCKALAQRLGLDVYAEAQEVIGVHLDNATKGEISTFIEHLMAMNPNG